MKLCPAWSVLECTYGISYLNQVFDISIPKKPLLCVLGLAKETQGDEFYKSTLQQLLYHARKLIATYWLSSHKMQYIILMKSRVYMKRWATLKFEKIWGTWLACHGISFNANGRFWCHYFIPYALILSHMMAY